ncbi:MAG: PepSY domain-containing protein [Gammaproteobacteria bacterium]
MPTPESVPPAVEAPAPTAAVMQRGGISLDQAIRIASERYPGRVVRAETTMRGGRVVHEVRILMEGDGNARMRIVRIDAETGRFL